MKTTLALTLFILIPLLTIAQKDTLNDRNFGIHISSAFDHFYTITLNPNITYTIKKHAFSLGPTIFTEPDYYLYNNVSFMKLSGVQGTYQFYPIKQQKILDFFIEYDFIYQKFKELNGTVENYRDQYLGYGLKIKFLQKFYINQNIGLGINYLRRIPENDNPSDTPGKYSELGIIVKFGLGYQFK